MLLQVLEKEYGGSVPKVMTMSGMLKYLIGVEEMAAQFAQIGELLSLTPSHLSILNFLNNGIRLRMEPSHLATLLQVLEKKYGGNVPKGATMNGKHLLQPEIKVSAVLTAGATRPPRLLCRAKKRNMIIVCSGIGIQAPRFLGDAELDEIIPQPT